MSGANASPKRSAIARSLKERRSDHEMSSPVIIFKDLPATFPERDKYKKSSVISSVLFHGLLILMVLTIPLLLPQSISERELLVTLISPIGPPPAPPPPPVEMPFATVPQVTKPEVRPATPDVLVMPTAIPKEIANFVEEPIAPPPGVIGGVPGGAPGGIVGGVLGGVLSSNLNANLVPVVPPPPPAPVPPPAPSKITLPLEPIRVGGNVQEPRPIKMVAPIYPPLASRARVSGVVVLEATLTAQGTVEEIHVVSGHPLLVEAAIACVKQWQYEPTLLNGVPVPVILTAKVHFERAPIS
jgi:protein TonB